MLKRLKWTDVRNLQASELEFDPQFNVIFGENGSGKSSLLEAIYLLSTAKSFRVSRQARVIRHGADSCLVYGDLIRGDKADRVGLKRYKKGRPEIRHNSETLRSVSELARLMPMLVLDTGSMSLIDEGPTIRRQFLDWLVFHVKHEFHHASRGYKQALQQRNALLKSLNPDMEQIRIFEKQMSEFAHQVDNGRRSVFSDLSLVLDRLLDDYLPSLRLSVSYQRGWDDSKKLLEIMEQRRHLDIKYGVSRDGPHRADLVFLSDGAPAAEVLSRGQKKVLVTLLKLAQLMVFRSAADSPCILLVDDLPAELDERFLQSMIACFSSVGAQVFLTSIQKEALYSKVAGVGSFKLFHVKHGLVEEE